MADGKWIAGLRAEMPLPEAARHVLDVRLRVVAEYLPRVLHASDDPENVHQLRVATRRADAALRIFEGCLPEKAFRGARRRLRGLRRAAGAARDWDVFGLALEERRGKQPEAERPGLDYLIGYAAGERAAVQEPLAAVTRDQQTDFADFLVQVRAAVRHPDERPTPTLLSLARPTLARLRGELERAAAGNLTDYVQLHQVRIAGKRLRYAMEVFADCFAAAFRTELYPAVEEMQEILGRANDSHVAAERLGALRERLDRGAAVAWKRYAPGIERLLRFHQRRLPQERRRFLRWWESWRAKGDEALLGTVLNGERSGSAPLFPRSGP
jgi:CHAD domain-containing protein